MPGMDECRLCGDCCVGCVFLYYDEQQDLLGCLIYHNKHRQRVAGSYLYSHYVKGNQADLEHFFEELLAIIGEEKAQSDEQPGICDHYQCWKMKDRGQVLFNIRANAVFRDLQLTEARIQQGYRNLVSTFQDLVDILNS